MKSEPTAGKKEHSNRRERVEIDNNPFSVKVTTAITRQSVFNSEDSLGPRGAQFSHRLEERSQQGRQ